MNWYLKAWNQYADFSGRARRKEYWLFTLFNFISALVAVGIGAAIGAITSMPAIAPVLYVVYMATSIIPSFAVTVRRLHDVGKSGWMFLVGLIPFIGGIWLLVLTLTDSEANENKWGPNPKAAEL